MIVLKKSEFKWVKFYSRDKLRMHGFGMSSFWLYWEKEKYVRIGYPTLAEWKEWMSDNNEWQYYWFHAIELYHSFSSLRWTLDRSDVEWDAWLFNDFVKSHKIQKSEK